MLLRLIQNEKFMAMVYGLGGAIVIIGALFKLMHWKGGGMMLIVGLMTEALIFIASAFQPIRHEREWEWDLVYPELSDEDSRYERKITPESVLSDKINELLEAASIDQSLISRLGQSIRSFEDVARNISPNVEAISSTQRYSEQLSLASERVKALNSVYKLQLENTNNQAAINEEITKATSRVKEQMESFASNLSSLNKVYGGMLNAMTHRQQ